ncbi:hypothetical protein CMUST_04155 [Corynebacterium mustelae]|uniref:Uncharacterized protein n=1 Tax=Corynebacterium mustelae TaxID=571915 RepID=A0A0G3GVL6_9CORY|nr:hypothetical protein CMUST_04155 [Corynebacterium mustelae]
MFLGRISRVGGFELGDSGVGSVPGEGLWGLSTDTPGPTRVFCGVCHVKVGVIHRCGMMMRFPVTRVGVVCQDHRHEPFHR